MMVSGAWQGGGECGRMKVSVAGRWVWQEEGE